MQKVHTLIIGSGAAGLCTAARLRSEGIDDILVASDGLDKGTSINTGSDKQTYYKISLCGKENDSVHDLAATLYCGGAMHGDIALTEAALSARAFMHLVNLGVKFPTDRYGQFAGYKTDHDPRQRATTTGPYTSRDMCLALIKQVRELQIPVKENYHCVRLLVENSVCYGAVFEMPDRTYVEILADYTVFAVGGPGNLYEKSVYPESQVSSIGLALEIGAQAHNLPESQFGLASTKFRWNVSGTYMQVIPRFVSTEEDGSGEEEFLLQNNMPAGRLYSLIFLKGYQWPFDAAKAADGSSQIDLWVHRETLERRRKVFLDFRSNPQNLVFGELLPDAYWYLKKSGGLFGTPIDRLSEMNPAAIQLYADHNIDLRNEMLEIAVCAQHNNGGLAATHWYESVNVKNLFPVGEVNGSHGITRPGGAALNAGQAGAFRAAEYIAHKRGRESRELTMENTRRKFCRSGADDAMFHQPSYSQLQQLMSRCGGIFRRKEELPQAVRAAREIYLQTRSSLALTYYVYLDAVRFSAEAGVGSRGSALLLDNGRVTAENPDFRRKVLVSWFDAETSTAKHRFEDCRPIPESDLWFETAWKSCRSGDIYT
ncbi:MAG: FAD-binding protein [Planctomycetaceae bacterium]|jgi:succinate dehydrogenase/fumarate reductase flavoprotein subunit|nr:FAD-binding protein [Planctomycetaceae bacterium]